MNDTASAGSSDFADSDEFDEQRDESMDRRQETVYYFFPPLILPPDLCVIEFVVTECNVLTVTGADNGPSGIQRRTLLKLFQTMMQDSKAMMTLLGKQLMMKSILGSVNGRRYLVVLRERKRMEMKSTNGMKTMLSTRKRKKKKRMMKILKVAAKKIAMNPGEVRKCHGEKLSQDQDQGQMITGQV